MTVAITANYNSRIPSGEDLVLTMDYVVSTSWMDIIDKRPDLYFKVKDIDLNAILITSATIWNVSDDGTLSITVPHQPSWIDGALVRLQVACYDEDIGTDALLDQETIDIDIDDTAPAGGDEPTTTAEGDWLAQLFDFVYSYSWLIMLGIPVILMYVREQKDVKMIAAAMATSFGVSLITAEVLAIAMPDQSKYERLAYSTLAGTVVSWFTPEVLHLIGIDEYLGIQTNSRSTLYGYDAPVLTSGDAVQYGG